MSNIKTNGHAKNLKVYVMDLRALHNWPHVKHLLQYNTMKYEIQDLMLRAK